MKAYDVIKKYGWTRNDYGDKDRGFCVAGAIHKAYPQYSQYIKARNKVTAHVGQFVILWNDTQGRTKAQVLKALKACRV